MRSGPDVFPSFLGFRIVVCTVLFDLQGYGDILEYSVPDWVDNAGIVLGVILSAHLCLQLIVGKRVMDMLADKKLSE